MEPITGPATQVWFNWGPGPAAAEVDSGEEVEVEVLVGEEGVVVAVCAAAEAADAILC